MAQALAEYMGVRLDRARGVLAAAVVQRAARADDEPAVDDVSDLAAVLGLEETERELAGVVENLAATFGTDEQAVLDALPGWPRTGPRTMATWPTRSRRGDRGWSAAGSVVRGGRGRCSKVTGRRPAAHDAGHTIGVTCRHRPVDER